jgi:HD-GYP domain-containing protein (c-di-GMP phosphodiesterase class II)
MASDQTRAGLLHDIGKLAVSNAILDKPGNLTGAEFARVKGLPEITHEVLKRVAPFRGIVEGAASHHEKLDGSGYHRGLSTENLSPRARILAVADVFDTLSRGQTYRPAMPMEKVLSILERERDDKLCPEPVAAPTELVEKGELR